MKKPVDILPLDRQDKSANQLTCHKQNKQNEKINRFTCHDSRIYFCVFIILMILLTFSGCNGKKHAEPIIAEVVNTDATGIIPSESAQITDALRITSPPEEAVVTNSPEEASPAPSVALCTPTAAPSSVTLLAVGDNLIHEQVVESGKQKDGTYNFDHLYSRVKDIIASADIAVINQETILGGSDFAYSGYPDFNSPTEIGDAIINTGFDVVLQATNHTMDMKLKGVENVIEYWSGHPEITTLGINATEKASKKIPIINKNGIKIAMLNYTYGLNGHTLPEDMPYLVNLLDKDKMAEDIQKAEEQADFTIVFPHWGTEYSYQADDKQKKLTDFFYEQGVDLVIGSHPHVLEPVEWIQKDNDRKMLVYYSLGNFMSYQKEAPRMLGGMASVTITKDASGTYVSNASITPILTHFESGYADYNYGIYELKDYNEELANRHGVSKIAEDGALTYQGMCDLAGQILGSWYQP